MKVVCGLGNPGRRYENTRHNIGWMVVDAIAAGAGARLRQKGSLYMWANARIGGEEVLLVKPLTYMNNSGQAVAAIFSRKGDPVSDLVVVHDDLDLDVGILRIKAGGGHGGHNGLRSICAAISTKDFVRVKLGIGRDERVCVSDYVLSGFRRGDAAMVREMIKNAEDAVCAIVSGDDVDSVMNKFN